jgi:ectoine hydroxylase
MLTAQQKNDYHNHGHLLLKQQLPLNYLQQLCLQTQALLTQPDEGTVFEADQKTVRALHGSYRHNPTMAELTQLPKITHIAKQLLLTPCYLYQFKINLKAANGGEVWPWHQDSIFWQREDGLANNRAINIAIALDHMDKENGGLQLLSGSHQHGNLCTRQPSSDSWQAGFSQALKYQVNDATLAQLKVEHPCAIPSVAPGDLLVFHPDIVHASMPNHSARTRRVIYLSYADINNQATRPFRRPPFIINHQPQQL